jgi:uncharacterized protein
MSIEINKENKQSSSPFVEAMSQGYAFTGESFYLGNAMQNGLALQAAISLPLSTMNRHGLIAGATGTGKTKTLQKILESLSASGVPSLVLDIKGDLSGIAFEGVLNDKVVSRNEQLKPRQEWSARKLPVEFLTISGASVKGVKVRATVTEFGPVLLSKALSLNDTQSSIISLIFKYCDDNGLLLLDLNDLKKVLQYLSTDGKESIAQEYGTIAMSSMSTIIRNIIDLEAQGGADVFGEASFEVGDLTRTDSEGRGYISVLRVADIQSRPKLFSTVMLSLLSEIYEDFAEMGDVEKPKLCVFIDEAHLLFDNASQVLLDNLEQMVKLIRSKGVGIYFITQNPTDIPAPILSQLGLKIQHALRAFTANDNKAISLAADNFPTTSYYETKEVLTSMGIGEALVTCLDEKGNPTPLVQVLIAPPETRMDTITDQELEEICQKSMIVGKYEQKIDRESAYEVLGGKMLAAQQALEAKKQEVEAQKTEAQAAKTEDKESKRAADEEKLASKKSSEMFGTGSIFKSILRSITVTATGAVVRQIIRGILGGTKKR